MLAVGTIAEILSGLVSKVSDLIHTYLTGLVGNDNGGFSLLRIPSNVLIFSRDRILVLISTYFGHSWLSFSGSSGAIDCCKSSILPSSDTSTPWGCPDNYIYVILSVTPSSLMRIWRSCFHERRGKTSLVNPDESFRILYTVLRGVLRSIQTLSITTSEAVAIRIRDSVTNHQKLLV